MNDHRTIAVEAAKEAGDILLELSKSPLEYKLKSARDIQAEADLKADEIIKAKIKAAFPDHNILAEESGDAGVDSKYLWVIDPLDGTINYARGIEEYAVFLFVWIAGQSFVATAFWHVAGEGIKNGCNELAAHSNKPKWSHCYAE